MADEKKVQNMDDEILKKMAKEFLEETVDRVDQLNLNLIQLEGDPGNKEFIDIIFRLVHSIKGSSGFAGLSDVSKVAFAMEDIFGRIKKGACQTTQPLIDAMFDAHDVMSNMLDQELTGKHSQQDTSDIISHLEGLAEQAADASKEEESSPDNAPHKPHSKDELFDIYKKGYNQLTALKHMIFSIAYLSDEESLAALVSKQIYKANISGCNEIWLVRDGKTIVQIAHDGERISESERKSINIDSSPLLERLINRQVALWSSSEPEIKAILKGFESPILIPLKAQPMALGFIVFDPDQSAETELLQFLGQYVSMVLKNAKLHNKVDEQRQELDEMTAILLRQNAILSSLYHVELALMKINNTVDLCRLVTESFVHDLETRSAAIFLKHQDDELRGLWGSNLDDIDSLTLKTDAIEPIKKVIETGRIVTQSDFPGRMELGSNVLDDWVIMGIKGREMMHGIIVAELDLEDVTDSMSILANYSGILLDNLEYHDK